MTHEHKPRERLAWTQFGDKIDLILRLLFAAAVTVGIYWVLSPFLTAILIAAILAVVTWPIFRRILKALNNRHTAAAVTMVGGLIVLVLFPLSWALVTLAQRIPQLITWGRQWVDSGFALPDWVFTLPWVGPWLQSEFGTGLDMSTFAPTIQKMIEPVSNWILAAAVNVSHGLLQMAIVTFIIFFFYRDGSWFAQRVKELLERLSGNLSDEFFSILVNTTRSVIFGLIGTALAQGVVAGIGFYLTDVPRPIVLSALVTLLSIIPIGPPLVWMPAAAWLYATGHAGAAVFLVLWGIFAVSSVDNFIKPILISRGSSLPLALIFLGVFGGVIAFGFLGLILGPVLLALGLAMLDAWMKSSLGVDQTDDTDTDKPNSPATP